MGHMNIAESIEATGLIFHVGSAGPEGSKEKAIHNTIQGMRKVLKNAPGKTYLILENGSGGGGKIGTTLQELSTIIKGVGSPRVKVCLDTAHIWGAGLLDFSPQGITTFFDEAEKKLGKNRIIVLHANDSKVEFGSMKDRHENIGEGAIGLGGFKNLAKERRVATLPWILEVPGFEGKGPDKKNVQRLNSVFK